MGAGESYEHCRLCGAHGIEPGHPCPSCGKLDRPPEFSSGRVEPLEDVERERCERSSGYLIPPEWAEIIEAECERERAAARSRFETAPPEVQAMLIAYAHAAREPEPACYGCEGMGV